jgi:hypothetical protein
LRAEDFLARARKATLTGDLEKGDELIEVHVCLQQIIADLIEFFVNYPRSNDE